MRKIFSLLALMFLTVLTASAQMFTSSPSPLQESSENVVITFHADQSGVSGLTNLPETTALYAHIGVYTTSSPNSWSHVPTTWGKALPDYQFIYVSPNTYTLTIGDLRTYFNITDPNEHITKVCIIARNEKGTIQTSDQFIDVVAEGFQMTLASDATDYIMTRAKTVKFSVNASQNAELKLLVNNSQVAQTASGMSLEYSYTFNDKGAYTVTAMATSPSGESETRSLHFLYIDNAVAATYPGGVPKMGAVKNSDGSVTFCLCAPMKNSVVLMPSWDNYEPLERNVMKYQDYNGYRYFWTTVTGLDNSKAYPYYYVVDGTKSVADPYAHLVLDCYNDKWLEDNVYPERPKYPYDRFEDKMLAVYQGNIDDYNWKVNNFNIPSHENLNVYELLLRDFTGSNSKADGTLRAAIEKIPYLKQLGINAVELMPIMEFNGNNSWGYNTNFYMAPDKAYGSPNDYKEFIDKCHEAGIAVILDIVFNQSDGLHPWYQMYSISSNPFYNQYAPHDYSVLNDWKQENPVVQQQWADAIRYWMTNYKVDGFRFDLVKGLGTNYPSGTETYNSTRVAVMKQLHNVIKSVNPKGIHINELLAAAKEENEMGADGQLNWANLNWSSCQYAMGYTDGADLRNFHATNYGRTIGTTVAYAESHDEERMGYKQLQWGASGVKGNTATSMLRLGSVAAQMLMTPGSKMVWQFGELGADETTKTPDGGNATNPKKVVWDYLDNADRKGLHDCYAELLNVRLKNPQLFSNNTQVNFANFANNLQGRSLRLNSGNQEIVVLINPAVSGSVDVTANTNKITSTSYQVLSSSYGFNPVVSGSGNSVTVNVPAHCYVVLGTRDLTGIEEISADTHKAAKVFVEGGCVMVAGEYNNLEVYSLTGARVDHKSALTPGVYVVRVDSETTKVVVK